VQAFVCGRGTPVAGPAATVRDVEGATTTMKTLKSALRRHMPLVVFLAALAWIITIVVLITLNPTPGGGSPV
jgi:hypothetical protein